MYYVFYNDTQIICGKPNSQLNPQGIKAHALLGTTGHFHQICMHITQQRFQMLSDASIKNRKFTPWILAPPSGHHRKTFHFKTIWYHSCWGHALSVPTHTARVVCCCTLSQEGNKYSTSSSSTTGHVEDATRYFHLLSGGKLQQGRGFPQDTIIACSPRSSSSHTECRKEQAADGCSVKTADLLPRNSNCICWTCWKTRGSRWFDSRPRMLDSRTFTSSAQIGWGDRILGSANHI